MEFQQEVLILVLHFLLVWIEFSVFLKFQKSGDFRIAINNNLPKHWHRNEQRFVQHLRVRIASSRAGIVKQAKLDLMYILT
jgi:hypothetical protein